MGKNWRFPISLVGTPVLGRLSRSYNYYYYYYHYYHHYYHYYHYYYLFLAGCPVLVVPTDHQKHIDHLEVINDWKLLISATNWSILVERKCFKLFLYSPELTSSSMFSSSTRPWAQFKPLEMLSVLPLTNVFAVIKRRRRKQNA